jgi:hypothetical protein
MHKIEEATLVLVDIRMGKVCISLINLEGSASGL